MHIATMLGARFSVIDVAGAQVTWDGWYADTAPLTRAGIPAICYGPQGRIRGGGSGYSPKEGEHANVVDLTKGVEVFVRSAHDICERSRAGAATERHGNTRALT